jgi:helicase
MKIIELSTIGEEAPGESGALWQDLGLDQVWMTVVQTIAPHSEPSEIQVKAIREAKLLNSRRNLLISGPTNSGKTLLAYLPLLKGVLAGGRVLLLEPLRAIAQEKFEELQDITAALETTLGRRIEVTISTGDYRMDEETLQSPPPENGEIVIATPERIEAILRVPEFEPWIGSLTVVCVDEAHLLGDRQRGASLEYVITSFRCQAAPPRMILLSATLGDTESLASWLQPCDVVMSQSRRPPLQRTLLQMEPEDDLQVKLIELAREILNEPGQSVMIFVYQTTWAAALARTLQTDLGELCGASGAACYHSRMSSASKGAVRRQVLDGSTRCVVSTAALAMGVNLPVTHVIVRDLNYGPGQPLPAAVLQQMTGRAGRGNRPGQAYLILKVGDLREAQALCQELDQSELPALRSVFLQPATSANGPGTEPPLARAVLSVLARRPEGRVKTSEIERFISNTMNGAEVVGDCQPALKWLGSVSNLLAHEEDGEWISTRLGQAAVRASLPLKTATGVAQLIRDLTSIDETDQMLLALSPLDILLLTELTTQRPVLRKSFSEAMVAQVDDWASREESKSVLFQNWIRGKQGFSKASEILGSLGVDLATKATAKDEVARKFGYLAMLRAIILWQRAHGALPGDLERRWKVKDLDEIQEPWRDDRLFLLGATINLWDLRCFFFHLKEECQASDQRIQRVKRALQRVRGISLRLMNLVSWCSPLGPVFSRLRANRASGQAASPAQGTMRRLEDAGILSVDQLRTLTLEDFKRLGVRSDIANQIFAFLRRR